MVIDISPQQACLSSETVEVNSRRRCSEQGVTHRSGEIGEGCVKLVPLPVGRHAHVEPVQRIEFVGNGEIGLMLPEFIVDIHQRGVGIEIVHVVAGILGVDLHGV